MITTIAEILIFILVLGAIGFPIFRKVKRTPETFLGEGDALHELLYKKDAVYTAIKDLEFDYQSGKLTETDYSGMKERFEQEAIEILEKVDQLQKQEKERIKSGAPKAPEKVFCTRCGTENRSSHNFCFSCGHKISIPQ